MDTQNFSQDDAQFNYEIQARALADIERCGIGEIVASAKDQGLEIVRHYDEFTILTLYTGYDDEALLSITEVGDPESLRANLAGLFVDLIQQVDDYGEAFQILVANANDEMGPAPTKEGK